MELNNLIPLVHKRKRIGRGGSRGGTSGKGSKGQNARSGGGVAANFEGGQMPLTRRLPKRGFSNAPFKIVYEIINLDRLALVFDNGAEITPQALVDKGFIKGKKTGLVKILGDGDLTKKFIVHAHAFSKSAGDAIKSQGGEVHLINER